MREDKEKLFFTILDYTGSATRNFADPDFDGEPPLITEEEINYNGDTIAGTETILSDPPHPDDEIISNPLPPESGGTKRKYYITEGEVLIVAESVHIHGTDGKLRTIEFTQFAKEQIATLFPSANELKSKWCKSLERQQIINELENNGISIEQLMDITKQKEADPFDLLCFVAYNLKPKTRKQRSELLQKNRPDFFSLYSAKAQNVLKMILEKYVDFGLNQIRPDIISTDPIRQEGNEIEIVNEFGGIDKYKQAIEQLQILLYTEAA